MLVYLTCSVEIITIYLLHHFEDKEFKKKAILQCLLLFKERELKDPDLLVPASEIFKLEFCRCHKIDFTSEVLVSSFELCWFFYFG